MLILHRNKIDIYMNKVKSLFCICIAAMGMQNTNAQTRAELEIRENPQLATGKYLAYEAPTTPLTLAPEGYVPCYISTYVCYNNRFATLACRIFTLVGTGGPAPWCWPFPDR